MSTAFAQMKQLSTAIVQGYSSLTQQPLIGEATADRPQRQGDRKPVRPGPLHFHLPHCQNPQRRPGPVNHEPAAGEGRQPLPQGRKRTNNAELPGQGRQSQDAGKNAVRV